MKKIIVAFAAMLLCSISYSQSVYENYVDGELYFMLKKDVVNDATVDMYGRVNYKSFGWLNELLKDIQVRTLRRPFWMTGDDKLMRTYHLDFIETDKVDAIIRKLNSSGLMEYVEKVAKREYIYTPNDPAVSDGNQQYLHLINAPGAWDHAKGNNIVIAITDSGTDTGHPDLITNLWVNTAEKNGTPGVDDDGNGYVDDIHGYNVAGNNGNVNPTLNDPHPIPVHGTHVAGISGADTDNGKGLGSVGFNAKIMVVKNASSIGLTNAAESVTYAASNGADVINMSWGGLAMNQTEQNAVNFAESKGAILIGGAGNDGQNAKFYPAAYSNVISVAGTDDNDVLGTWSNRGTWIDVCAPGADIMSIIPLNWIPPGGQQNPGVMFLSGTSHSAPIVSGITALMLSVKPGMTISDVRSCLKSSAINIDGKNPGQVGLIGAGRVDAEAAVLCAMGQQGPAADAGILVINKPTGTVCSGSFDPIVRLKNYGSPTLTSVSIKYRLGSGVDQNYQWTGNLASGSLALVTLPTISIPTPTGAKTFTAWTESPNGDTDANSTNDSKSSNFTTDGCVGINEFDNPDINIYPNPSSGQVFVDPGSISAPYSIKVNDALGKLMFEQDSDMKNDMLVDLSNLDRGIYFINIANEHGSFSQRLILNK